MRSIRFRAVLALVCAAATFDGCLPKHGAPRSSALDDESPRYEPDWSENARIPPNGRANIYHLAASDLALARRNGLNAALNYPVTSTALLVPFRIFRATIESGGPFKEVLKAAGFFSGQMTSVDDFYAWLGLYKYSEVDDDIPLPNDEVRGARMGVSFIQRGQATGMTFGCAACHFGQLFGRPVPGLTTRFPRANEFFLYGAKVVGLVQSWSFRLATGATADEVAMVMQDKNRFKFIGVHKPAALGLDTSVMQVGTSLSKRGADPYASTTNAAPSSTNQLDHLVADSKPAVWWNVKYKNRWLSDGSVASGNPVVTNLLWNEIGRGADLHEFEAWVGANGETIKQLTAAVFATEAPRYTEFFPAETIDLAAAKAGEGLFNNHCASCHGRYLKGWERSDQNGLTLSDQLATTKVIYPSSTAAVDVGTDPGRCQALAWLAPLLNNLAFSQAQGIVVEPQQGYVPPPLVGIWARWPYFHNNSVPSLCAVLTRASLRPSSFVTGEPLDRDNDFDRHCNGYPLESAAPAAWVSDPEHHFDTTRPGLSNQGHDEGIFLRDGVELLSSEEKAELIEYLKTL